MAPIRHARALVPHRACARRDISRKTRAHQRPFRPRDAQRCEGLDLIRSFGRMTQGYAVLMTGILIKTFDQRSIRSTTSSSRKSHSSEGKVMALLESAPRSLCTSRKAD